MRACGRGWDAKDRESRRTPSHPLARLVPDFLFGKKDIYISSPPRPPCFLLFFRSRAKNLAHNKKRECQSTENRARAHACLAALLAKCVFFSFLPSIFFKGYCFVAVPLFFRLSSSQLSPAPRAREGESLAPISYLFLLFQVNDAFQTTVPQLLELVVL